MRSPFKQFLMVLPVLFVASLSSCGGVENFSFNGAEFDISINQDRSLIAKTVKNNNNYSMSVEGSGASLSYASTKAQPYYTISKKINQLTIGDGVTSLGDYLFTSFNINYVVAGKDLLTVSDNAFDNGVVIYSYATSTVTAKNRVYYYSENAPTGEGNYWYLRDGVPAIWKQYKVLFIGNSFTYYSDIPTTFGNIANNLGEVVYVDRVTQGAWTLERFADANDEYGAKVEQKLQNNQYDYVIIQEHSTRPVGAYNNFLNGAKALYDKVKLYQDNAELRLYATWGFASGANTYADGDIVAFEGQLREAYASVARELGVKYHPVGQAFSEVYTNYKSINLYYTDDKHPSAYGAYLSALVHVASLFSVDVNNTTWNSSFNQDTGAPLTIDDNTASILKQVAQDVASLYK